MTNIFRVLLGASNFRDIPNVLKVRSLKLGFQLETCKKKNNCESILRDIRYYVTLVHHKGLFNVDGKTFSGWNSKLMIENIFVDFKTW